MQDTTPDGLGPEVCGCCGQPYAVALCQCETPSWCDDSDHAECLGRICRTCGKREDQAEEVER